jgi:hypothetical protein
MQPGFEGGHRQRGMERIRGGDHHGVQLCRQQPLHVGIEFLDAIASADSLAHRGRGIGQGDKSEALALFPQIEGMLGLANEARTHQSDPKLLQEPSIWNDPSGRN